MKIDCHVHLVGASDESGCYLSKKMRRSFSYNFILWQFGLAKVKDPAMQERLYIDRLASQVRTSEVDRAVLLAFDKTYSRSGEVEESLTHTYVPNDFVLATRDANPDVFMACASVHPYRHDALEALSRVRERGAVMVKLLPNSQGFDPSDPQILPYFKKMRDLGLVLLMHAGYEHTIPAIDQTYGFPEKLRPVLDEGLQVVIAHMGTSGLTHWHETFKETLKLLRDYPNCFCDTSALTNFWRTSYLFSVLDEALEHKYGVTLEDPFSRMIHGSDYPIPLTPSVFFFRLTREQRREVRRVKNSIEQDVMLKRYAGVPDACLTRAKEVLFPEE